MKTKKLLYFLLFALVMFTGCKKNKPVDVDLDGVEKPKVHTVSYQQFMEEVKKAGIVNPADEVRSNEMQNGDTMSIMESESDGALSSLTFYTDADKQVYKVQFTVSSEIEGNFSPYFQDGVLQLISLFDPELGEEKQKEMMKTLTTHEGKLESKVKIGENSYGITELKGAKQFELVAHLPDRG